ncbi:metal-dependent hydrolase [Vibrio parahaemolyticus]
MDSITQALLGCTIAGAISGKRCNFKVLLSGAALGTLPDLDVFIDYGDAVSNTINHRSFSHSLLILPIFSLLISWMYCKWRRDKYWTFKRVLYLVSAILITHPLLDSMTTYGTQLLWPISGYFEVRNIFIIDPIYTITLLVSILSFLFLRKKSKNIFKITILVSSLYLLWGYVAQQIIYQRVVNNLSLQNIPDENVLITPTPFNTILWRVVVKEHDKYWEGLASILDQDMHIEFIQHPLGSWPFKIQPDALVGLLSFSHEFLRFREEDNKLIISDLRIGFGEYLRFEYIFANKDKNGIWKILEHPLRYPSEHGIEHLSSLWLRLKGDKNINAKLQKIE